MPDYVLEIVEGPEAGRQIPLAGPVVIGRDPVRPASRSSRTSSSPASTSG